MIPKIIHYCWFGRNKIPDQLQLYMKSWKKYCPDYQIKLWDEDSFDVNSVRFVEAAYKAGKYAFVSDYVRVYALHEIGGIYLDTDVELKDNIDIFLEGEAFSGRESLGSPFSAVWGSIQGHSLLKRLMDYYKNRDFSLSEEANTNIVSNMLIEKFGIDPWKNVKQTGSDGLNQITIYPIETFTLDLEKNYATHHFYGSWLVGNHRSVKKSIKFQYNINELNADCEEDREALITALGHRMSVGDGSLLLLKIIYHKMIPSKIDSFFSYLRGHR